MVFALTSRRVLPRISALRTGYVELARKRALTTTTSREPFVSSSFPDDFDSELLDKGVKNTTAEPHHAPKYGQQHSNPSASETRAKSGEANAQSASPKEKRPTQDIPSEAEMEPKLDEM